MESVLRYLIGYFPDLLEVNLTASIVILFVICARLILRRAPKIFSYVLWAIVLLRLLVPISIESSVSVVPEQTEFVSMVELNEAMPRIEFESPGDRATNQWIQKNTPPGEPFAQTSRCLDAQTYLTFSWLAGMVFMLLRSVVSYWKLRKRVRVAIPLRKGIYIADDIDTPFVMGIFRPVIYLPGTLDKAERKYIIAHERHHIRRGDHIFKALGFLALTVHWFNPLVWVAFVLANRDMEMSCDEAVIRKFGEDVRADYSASLLNLATGHRLFAGTPLAFGEGNPTGRVRNLAKWKKPTIWVILICLIICIVLAVCLLTDPQIPEPKLTITFLELDTNNVTDIILQNNHNGEMTFISDKQAINEICSIIKNIGGINGLGGRHHYEGSYSLTLKDGSEEIFSIQFGDTDAFFYGIDDDGYAIRYELQDLSIDGIIRMLSPYDTSGFQWDFLQESEAEQQILESDWGVSIKPDRVSRTGATALFVYSGSIPGEEGAELYYGDLLILERVDENGNWVAVEELPGYEYYVGDSSYPVVDGYGMVHEWQDRFGELSDGHYRMGKSVALVRPDGSQKMRRVYGEFFIPESILTGPIPLEELPEKYGAEQAMIDGCVVLRDGDVSHNQEIWQEFLNTVNAGQQAYVRTAEYHYYPELSQVTQYVYDIRFDGNVYSVEGILNGEKFRKEYQYLLTFLGQASNESHDYDSYIRYVLSNEPYETWEKANGITMDGSIKSERLPQVVYTDLIYETKRPKLPANPVEATLECKGFPVVTVTDFDRLEKLWILFEDAEFLGYEPKTHSIGVGVNLLLTAGDGQQITIELDPDNDLARINGEYISYGKPDEPCYILKLWEYLGIGAWPEFLYESCPNAFRP